MAEENEFGLLLRAYRTAKGKTQVYLAELLSMSNNTVWRWESNLHFSNPNRATVVAIAEKLGLTDEQRDHLLTAAGYSTNVSQGIARLEQGIGGVNRTAGEVADAARETQQFAERIEALVGEIDETTRQTKETTSETGKHAKKMREEARETQIEVRKIHDTVGRIGRQVQEIWSAMNPYNPYLNAKAQPIPASTVAGVLNSNAQRVVLALLCLFLFGGLLAAFGVTNQEAMAACLIFILGLVMWSGHQRIRPYRMWMAVDFTGRSLRFAELLFVSIFVVLSAPLLQSSLTGIDVYGFFTLPYFTGGSWPLFLSLIVNFAISIAAAGVFGLCWLRAYSKSPYGSAFGKAAFVLAPSFGVAYVPAAFLGWVGNESYLLAAFAPLCAAFMIMLTLSDPSVKLSEWAAKQFLQWALAAIFLLFLASMAGVVLWYFQQDVVPPGNHLWAWNIDFSVLGYPAEDFPGKQAAGFLWAMLMAMVFLLIAVGGSLVATIYGCQIAPHNRNGAPR